MAFHDESEDRGVSLQMVLAEIAQGKTFPCYLLFGDEEFLLQNALERIAAALIPAARDRELNLFLMDGEREDLDVICESLMTPPLLPGRKVIVVRDTRLFQSRNILGSLVGKIREHLDQDPARAVSDFLRFLEISGLQLDDLRDSGWRGIDDETWKRIIPDEGGDARETWLPKAVDLCVSRGAAPAKERREETDRLEGILTGGMPEGNHLILAAEAVDRRKKLFKMIASAGRTLSFVKIKGEGQSKDRARLHAVQEMAADLLREGGKKLSSEAWSALGQKTGFDIRESLGAIGKLMSYCGRKPVIEAADVEAVVGRTKEERVFDLTGAVAERNLTAALRSVKELLDQGAQPLMIFSMIIREMRLLFQAKLLAESGRLGLFRADIDYGRFQKAVIPAVRQLASEGDDPIALASQHPFVIYQALKNAERFTRRELAVYLDLLTRADLALKSTGRDPRLLLESFIINLCGGADKLKP